MLDKRFYMALLILYAFDALFIYLTKDNYAGVTFNFGMGYGLIMSWWIKNYGNN